MGLTKPIVFNKFNSVNTIRLDINNFNFATSHSVSAKFAQTTNSEVEGYKYIEQRTDNIKSGGFIKCVSWVNVRPLKAVLWRHNAQSPLLPLGVRYITIWKQEITIYNLWLVWEQKHDTSFRHFHIVTSKLATRRLKFIDTITSILSLDWLVTKVIWGLQIITIYIFIYCWNKIFSILNAIGYILLRLFIQVYLKPRDMLILITWDQISPEPPLFETEQALKN